jgi:O-antigen ligase
LLIAGVAVSFSRAALLALLVGWVVYGIMARRFRSLVASIFAIALFVFSMILFIDLIEAATPHQEARLGHVRSFLIGDWSAGDSDNRTEIWRSTFQAIVERGSLVFGLGHGSMVRVADGLVPHNYYLSVLGNSGIIALFGLLIWNFVLAQQGWRCSRRETRSALLAIATIIGVVHVVDSGFLDFPPSGVIIACFVLAVCYGRDKTSSSIYSRRSISPARNPSFRAQGPSLPPAG